MRQSQAPTETVESGTSSARERNAMDADVRQNRAPTATVDRGTFSRPERSAVEADLLRRIVLCLLLAVAAVLAALEIDRKSTRLNSSHQIISYAVFCLKKKKDE